MIINEELGHNISGISDEEMLRQLVEKLKNNEKQISRELLQTKYRSSYERLRKDISVTADLIVKDRAWSGIYIQKDLEGEVLVQKIRELAQNSGVKKKIHTTLYVEYDVDRFFTGFGSIFRQSKRTLVSILGIQTAKNKSNWKN